MANLIQIRCHPDRAPYNPVLMENLPLAHHLALNAARHPDAPGLIYGAESLSLGALLAALRRTSASRFRRTAPVLAVGARRHLFEQTLLASLAERPFWPQERATPLAISPLPECALMLSTSGTEGRPKVVQLGLRALNQAARAANERLPIGPGDVWLHCLPLIHIGGQMILWRCYMAGAGICLTAQFDASEIAHCLARHPVSHLSLVPAMLAKLLDAGVRPPASLRHVLIGGAALHAALFARAQAAGWPLHPSYGMSETAAQIASWTPQDGPWQPGLAGRPLPGVEIRRNPEGRIEIRGTQRMLGYLGEARLPEDAWFTTGDTGYLDEAGCLHIQGRADDILISGGRNIHPQEIEDALSHHAGIRDIAVTALPDPVWGDSLMALFVGDSNPAQLAEYAARHLPPPLRPRRYLQLDSLPRNTAGKLMRIQLKQLAADNA